MDHGSKARNEETRRGKTQRGGKEGGKSKEKQPKRDSTQRRSRDLFHYLRRIPSYSIPWAQAGYEIAPHVSDENVPGQRCASREGMRLVVVEFREPRETNSEHDRWGRGRDGQPPDNALNERSIFGPRISSRYCLVVEWRWWNDGHERIPRYLHLFPLDPKCRIASRDPSGC